MAEFDDVLNAARISPGSQPGLQSNTPTSAARPAPETQPEETDAAILAAVAVDPRTVASTPGRVEADVAGAQAQTANCRVLISIDDTAVARVLRAVLTQAGYPCLTTPDAPQALRQTPTTDVSLVVVGATAPELTPLLALNRPTLVVGNRGDVSRARLAVGDRAAGFVKVPYERDELLRKVRVALRGERSIE